ncbi:MAG: hypothetical protein PVF15_05300 [Candidatus Bathyarchaeota archaeon]|jgi:hypothetical protein
MFAQRFLYAIIIASTFAAAVFVSPALANSYQENASLAISNAEETLILAYEVVLEAEQAGGNITGLLAELNRAGEFLAAARMSFKNGQNGDLDNVINLANLSKDIGEEVRNAAYTLKDSAWSEGVQYMLFTMLGSISGIILVVLASLWVWRFLKRRDQ